MLLRKQLEDLRNPVTPLRLLRRVFFLRRRCVLDFTH